LPAASKARLLRFSNPVAKVVTTPADETSSTLPKSVTKSVPAALKARPVGLLNPEAKETVAT